jgi:hypothetical protein
MGSNVMLDIETFDTRKTAMVVSLAAIHFDTDGNATKEFVAWLDLKQQLQCGRTMSPDTIMWWLRQDDAARQHLQEGPVLPVANVIAKLALFCAHTPVWSHSTFDFAIVEDLAATFNVEWLPYKQSRCVRTVLNLADVKPEHAVSAHNPLEDCKAQARDVAKALRKIKNV